MSQPGMRYYKAPVPADELPMGVIPYTEWIIFLGTTPNNGEVVVELHGCEEGQAEKVRKALAQARQLGRREVADDISSRAQELRLENVGAW